MFVPGAWKRACRLGGDSQPSLSSCWGPERLRPPGQNGRAGHAERDGDCDRERDACDRCVHQPLPRAARPSRQQRDPEAVAAAASRAPAEPRPSPALLPEPHGHGQVSAAQRDPTVCRPTCYPLPLLVGTVASPACPWVVTAQARDSGTPGGRRAPGARWALGSAQGSASDRQGEPRPGRALPPAGMSAGSPVALSTHGDWRPRCEKPLPGAGSTGPREVTRARLPGGAASRQASRSRPGMSSHALKSRGDRASRKASAGTRARPVLSQTTRGRECLSSSRRCAAENTPSLAHQNLRERAQGSGGARAASAPPPPAPQALRTTRAW